MNSENQTALQEKDSGHGKTRDKLFDPTRARFWLLIMILLYTVLGFLAVPALVRNQLIKVIEEDLGRSAQIEKVRFNPFSFRLGIHGFEMRDTDDVRLVAFDEFLADLQATSLLRRAWTFREIRLMEPFVLLEQFEDDDSRLGRLLADVAREEPAEKNAERTSFLVDEFAMAGGGLDFIDGSISPAAEVGIRHLEIQSSEISSEEQVSIPLSLAGTIVQGGAFNLAGQLILFPDFSMTAQISAKDLPLSLGQPYVQQHARVLIESGTVGFDLDLGVAADQSIAASGGGRISGLEIKDELENERLLGWQELQIDQFALQDDQLELSILKFAEPFGRIVVLEDQSTNLSGLVVETPGVADSENTAATSPQNAGITIAGISISDGSMAFSDLSLPLPFATFITRLNGTISSIASASSEPAEIGLEGHVNEYGLARIEGSINLLDPIQHTGVDLEFRNLLMSELSPYTVEFAGRHIDEGKLDLRLHYVIEEGQLDGENDIVISDLILGDKAEHPDAASLPLGLAVALLKDANGVIEIDLPVSGDLNSPEFKIGGVIRQAITGLITKVVSAPFRFLGKLIGIESEDLGEFKFLAGHSDLAPPEKEKILQVESALQQRPQLTVNISGVAVPAIDIPALQAMRLHETVISRLAIENDGETPAITMLDPEVLAVLESLFLERFQDVPLDSVKAEYLSSAADQSAAPVLDELAYSNGLHERLLATEDISEQDLAALANQRAESIKAAFLASGQLEAGRIGMTDPAISGAGDGEWVIVELEVGSK